VNAVLVVYTMITGMLIYKPCYISNLFLGGVSMNYPSHFVLVPAQENNASVKNNDGNL